LTRNPARTGDESTFEILSKSFDRKCGDVPLSVPPLLMLFIFARRQMMNSLGGVIER
jgi:hypothetical protein